VQELARGQRVKLDQLTPSHQVDITVSVTLPGTEVDLACFGVDAAGQLSDDRYMVFFNQLSSPEGAIALTGGSGAGTFRIDLDRLPAAVDKLVFTATIDGAPTMSQVSAGRFAVVAAGAEVGAYQFTGDGYAQEKAVMVAELYRKDGTWRLNTVGQGFNGGLSALLAHFGGEEAAPAPSGPAAAPGAPAAPAPAAAGINLKKVELDKKMEAEAPQLLSLAKKAQVSLEKKGLGNHQAKVALCLDISLSMRPHYQSGKVQALAERVLALGTRFDDDGEIDVFLFGAKAHQYGSMNIGNFRTLVPDVLARYDLELGTYYGKAMRLIREFYFGSAAPRSAPLRSDQPVYVMFVTDGAPMDERDTTEQVMSSAFEPLFWEFMAIGRVTRSASGSLGAGDRLAKYKQPSGNGEFAFLEGLDDMVGRYVDNADFFTVSDPAEVPDDDLYDLLMGEYPAWVGLLGGLGLV
jgi:stress response protein SCP2